LVLPPGYRMRNGLHTFVAECRDPDTGCRNHILFG
jgi:hypothetical protein